MRIPDERESIEICNNFYKNDLRLNNIKFALNYIYCKRGYITYYDVCSVFSIPRNNHKKNFIIEQKPVSFTFKKDITYINFFTNEEKEDLK